MRRASGAHGRLGGDRSARQSMDNLLTALMFYGAPAHAWTSWRRWQTGRLRPWPPARRSLRWPPSFRGCRDASPSDRRDAPPVWRNVRVVNRRAGPWPPDRRAGPRRAPGACGHSQIARYPPVLPPAPGLPAPRRRFARRASQEPARPLPPPGKRAYAAARPPRHGCREMRPARQQGRVGRLEDHGGRRHAPPCRALWPGLPRRPRRRALRALGCAIRPPRPRAGGGRSGRRAAGAAGGEEGPAPEKAAPEAPFLRGR